MASRTATTAAEPTPRGEGASERIVVAVLVLMAAMLAYLRFGFLARAPAAAAPVFDLRNPMLDARPGECVEVEDSSQPGSVSCVSVVAPSVVRRPPQGPNRIGGYEDLRRKPPYLVAGLSFPEKGKGCSAGERRTEDYLLFDLNGFGMPSGIHAEVQSIRPIWRRVGGKTRHTYEVQMFRHGQMAGPWIFWLAEDAPVTGVVFRTYTYGQGGTRQVVYREVPGCSATPDAAPVGAPAGSPATAPGTGGG